MKVLQNPEKHRIALAKLPTQLPIVISILILLITIIVYIPAMRGGFIWDDNFYVLGNPTLRTLDGLQQIWFDVRATPQYYPLVHTTFWMEYHLWGLQPTGYHITNVVLHSLVAILLYAILRRLTVPGAGIAAVIFAIHPVHVESVAWITERKNVLSALFYMLSLWYCLQAFQLYDNPKLTSSGRWKAYIAGLVFFVCALFSKTVTCSLPVVILILLWWKRGRLCRRETMLLIPMFLIGAVLGLTTAWIEKTHVGAGREWTLSLAERCLVAGRALWFYLFSLTWPSNLTFIYPRWHVDSGAWWQYMYPVAALGLGMVLWMMRKQIGRGPFAAALFFAVTLAPALGFIDVYPMRYSFVADHFQYLASIGPIVLFAAILSRRSMYVIPGRFLPPIQAVIIVILACLTWMQGFMYKDIETLWRTTIARNPSAWMAHGNLGNLLEERGDIAGATHHYKEALRLNPNDAGAHNNLGTIYLHERKYDECCRLFRRAIELNPDSRQAHWNLGAALFQQKHHEEGIAHLRLGLEDAQQHETLGNLLSQLGRMPEAVQAYRSAINLAPYRDTVRMDLAWILATNPDERVRHSTEAISHAKAACRTMGKQYARKLDILAAALADAGRFQEAIEIARKAIAACEETQDQQLARQIAGRLKLYQIGKPYHTSR